MRTIGGDEEVYTALHSLLLAGAGDATAEDDRKQSTHNL